MRTLYRLVYKNGDHGAWDDDIDRIRRYAKFFGAEIESRRYSMTLKEFKVWGGKREEKDSLYIWAKDADDAIGIARLTDQSICISQWTGNEKSYEEALEQDPCDDVISRAEAEAIFRNARSKLNPSDYKTADEFNTRDLMLLNAEQLIHLLPSVKPQEPKWIPVSERLPEIDEDGYSSYVLVSFSNFTLPCIGQLRKTDGENHWYEGDDEKALDSFGLHVNAWQPLPKPYKAESEGEK